MNERFEPRTSRSDLNRNDGGFGRPGDEDPLLELARIVSGRGPSEGSRRHTPMTSMEPANEADLARDLEAELLSDLQASFSMVRPPSDRRDDPRREDSRLEESGHFRRSGDRAYFNPPEPSEPQDPPAQPSFGFLSLRREAVYQPDFQVAPPADAAAPEEQAHDTPTVSGDGFLADPFQSLRLDYATDDAPTALTADEPSLEAPSLQAENDPPADWQANETFVATAGYEPTADQLQSLEPAPGRAGWRSRRGLTLVAGLFAVVLLSGVALIAFKGDDATAGPPLLIAADPSPTRIAALNTTPDAADANKLIYDRVDPDGAVGIETVLAPAEDPVPDVAGLGPAAGGAAPRVVLRGAPGDDAIGGILAADPAPAVGAAPGGETIAPANAPRRVRTVTVRPDGTIVENGAAPAGETPIAAPVLAAAPLPTVTPIAIEPTPVPTPAAQAAAAAATPVLIPQPLPEMVAVAPAAAAPAVEGPRIVSAVPAVVPATTAAVPVVRPVVATVPIRQVAAATPPARTPTPARNAPISLMPAVAATPAPAAAPAPAPVQVAAVQPATTAANAVSTAGTWVVQVSSQRSEEAAMAAFQALQTRMPTLLGGRSANIQRANLGDRGTFFRARVAPATTREAATQLCVSLKAAGVDCIVAQN